MWAGSYLWWSPLTTQLPVLAGLRNLILINLTWPMLHVWIHRDVYPFFFSTLQVYTRLNKLGVCLSHKAVTRIVKKMGDDHDKLLRVWQASVSKCGSGSHLPYVHIIIGDNIDKHITPQTMRVDNQVRSLHYFYAFAALSCVEILHLDDTKPMGDIKALPPVDISAISRRLFSTEGQSGHTNFTYPSETSGIPASL